MLAATPYWLRFYNDSYTTSTAIFRDADARRGWPSGSRIEQQEDPLRAWLRRVWPMPLRRISLLRNWQRMVSQALRTVLCSLPSLASVRWLCRATESQARRRWWTTAQ